MFGHQDDTSSQAATDAPQGDLIDGALNAAAIDTDRPSGEPTQPLTTSMATPTPDPAPAPDPTPVAPASVDPDWQHPDAPIVDDSQPKPQPDQPSEQEQSSDVISPAGGFPKRPSYQNEAGAADLDVSADTQPKASPLVDDSTTHELIDIRQKALGELAPVIDKLDLPPEEKFRTIMMVIQVSDDAGLVKSAYAAAHAITDEKDKAQALLDIVNEVNYFTNPKPK